ncbi:hypothetical protein REPUB_Repub10bG0142000 [Reevesia pubescens]
MNLSNAFASLSGRRFSGASTYGSSVRSSSSRRDYDGAKPPRKLDLDGLTPFEKNFYIESPSVATMLEKEVDEYRQLSEIIVEGRDIPKPVKSFRDAGFPKQPSASVTIIMHQMPKPRGQVTVPS